MKIKKRDLLNLYNAISELEGRPFSVKFSYFIAKNKVAMRDEISALDIAKRATDEFKSYDGERAKLAQKFADKNEDGSIDLYFGPTAPQGKESNWIETVPNKGFLVEIRLYGPLEAYFDRTWKMSDVERID